MLIPLYHLVEPLGGYMTVCGVGRMVNAMSDFPSQTALNGRV